MPTPSIAVDTVKTFSSMAVTGGMSHIQNGTSNNTDWNLICEKPNKLTRMHYLPPLQTGPRTRVVQLQFDPLTATINPHCIYIQGGSNMTGTNCDLFIHNQSRSYLNHLVRSVRNSQTAQCTALERPISGCCKGQ